MPFKPSTVAALFLAAFSFSGIALASDGTKAPASSATPSVVGSSPGVKVISLLTVGDKVNGAREGATPYRMVGIPDGLGAFDNGDGSFTLLMNHELGPDSGSVRRHGQKGSFVSKWRIRKSDLAVLQGEDLVGTVMGWDAAAGRFVASASPFARFCSADLAPESAFFNRRSGRGFAGRIFLNGEEIGAEGRAFAHLATGDNAGFSFELPSLGRLSWENAVASPFEQDKTIVIGQDDSTPGQVYVYIGEKQAAGSEIERAGLHGGQLYGIAVHGFPSEDDAKAETRHAGIPNGTRFALKSLGDVRGLSGKQLQEASTAAGVTEFLRPEDGAWHPRQPHVYYFATTDRFDMAKAGTGKLAARSRLYRLSFDDIRHPEKGGRIDTLLDGTGPYQMLDNLTVDGDGNLLLQEDPGNQDYLAGIWQYRPRDGRLVKVASHDPKRFAPAVAPFNVDEESSGIIEVTDLLRPAKGLKWRGRQGGKQVDAGFKGWRPDTRYFLATSQAHYALPQEPELVEGGQLFLLAVPKRAGAAKH